MKGKRACACRFVNGYATTNIHGWISVAKAFNENIASCRTSNIASKVNIVAIDTYRPSHSDGVIKVDVCCISRFTKGEIGHRLTILIKIEKTGIDVGTKACCIGLNGYATGGR